MARTDRATGKYATHAELRAAVQERLNLRPCITHAVIADQVEVSTGTISGIVKETRAGDDPVQVDLNKMFNKLWRIAT
jgi:hypothetical protein